VKKRRKIELRNDNYNSFSGDSYFSRLFWVLNEAAARSSGAANANSEVVVGILADL
jgi:hypothetical protein